MRTETAEKAAESRHKRKEAELEWHKDVMAGAELCRRIRDDQQADAHAKLRAVELLIQLSHERP